MHKLGYFVVLQTNTIFGIALHFLRNIKYHQEIWNYLSVEILWKFLTAGHQVHSRPCPAAEHLDTARKILVFRYSNFPSTLFYHPCHSLFFDRDHLRSNMGIISGPGSFAVQFGDHLRSGIICGPGVICGPVQCRSHFPCTRFSLGLHSRQISVFSNNVFYFVGFRNYFWLRRLWNLLYRWRH